MGVLGRQEVTTAAVPARPTHHEPGSTNTSRKQRISAATKSLTPYGFVAPSFLFLLAFGILPIVVAAVVSFTDLDITGLANPDNISYIGLENYRRLISDSDFWRSLQTTGIFIVFGVPSIIVISLTIALGLSVSSSRLFRVLRMFYFLPAITAIVAISLIWGFMYNTQFGLLNYLLTSIGSSPINWLSDPQMAKVSVAIVAIWRATGLNIIIFLAAIQSIPRDYYEAAAIDGATGWASFRWITFPLLRFALLFVTVTTLIAWLQFFDEPFVLTDGGPVGATTSISLFIYQEGFSFNRFGYASAGTVVLFLIIVTVTAFQLRLYRSNHA
ncbi:MAG: sugar ABC transporter permease [Actinobacteria bacterium]|nr:sugar ABC transporter permease [Actinomycetota bacterium]